MLRNSMTKIVLWIASKSKIFRNDGFNLQTSQLGYVIVYVTYFGDKNILNFPDKCLIRFCDIITS